MKKIFTSISFFLFIALFSVSAQIRVHTPELVSPENMGAGLMPDVVLSWNAVSGGSLIVNYDIQVDITPDFTNPMVFETELLSGIQMNELIFGQTYYWKVMARIGNETSDWSEIWSFKVMYSFTLKKPTDVSNQNTSVTLEWNEVTGITYYDYQFDSVYYWNDISGFTTDDLFDVFIVDDTSLWAVGKGGLILFHNGTEWTEQESGTTKDLLSVFFLDVNNGWAAGKSGTILYYDGSTWAAQESGTTKDINGLNFVSNTAGWAVAKGGVIIHYDGTAWASQTSGTTKDMNAVWFNDENNGWAVGKTGTVVYYDGSAWTDQETGTPKDMFAVAFYDNNNGWAAGKGGTIIQYKDGSWSVYEPAVTTKDIFDLSIPNESFGWGVGKAGIMVFFDGNGWYNPTSGTMQVLKGISFFNNTGMAVGEDGVMLQYSDDAFNSPMAVIRSVEGTETSLDVENLLFGVHYYWRMRARHSQDTSLWSAPKSFITVAAPELTDPDNGSSDNNLDVIFKWKKLSDNIIYEIYIDSDPAFSNPVHLETEEKEVEAELLMFDKLYYWKALARNSSDTSAWSEVWTLETIGTVYLSSPENGAVDLPLTPKLVWEEITGISEYSLQIDTDNGFSNPLVDQSVPYDESDIIVPVILAKGTEYFWRVRAINGLDSTSWSATWSFTTVPPVGIEDLNDKSLYLSIYPNPATDVIYVNMEAREALNITLSITDLLGKELVSEEIAFDSSIKKQEINVKNLPKGVYFLKLDNKVSSVVRKLVIR